MVHRLVSSPPSPHPNHLEVPVFLDSKFFKPLVGKDIDSLPHLLRTHHKRGGWQHRHALSLAMLDAGDMCSNRWFKGLLGHLGPT